MVSLFIGGNWLQNFIARQCFTMPVVTVVGIVRQLHGDKVNLAHSLILAFLTCVLLEASAYINMKAKAQLFL